MLPFTSTLFKWSLPFLVSENNVLCIYKFPVRVASSVHPFLRAVIVKSLVKKCLSQKVRSRFNGAYSSVMFPVAQSLQEPKYLTPQPPRIQKSPNSLILTQKINMIMNYVKGCSCHGEVAAVDINGIKEFYGDVELVWMAEGSKSLRSGCSLLLWARIGTHF